MCQIQIPRREAIRIRWIAESAIGLSLGYYHQNERQLPTLKLASAERSPKDGHRFAEKTTAGKWKFANVDDTRKGGGYISLAFDSKGRAGMSYFVSDSEDLRYAHFDGRKWVKETVASKGSQGKFTTLMFDSANQPNIFFYNGTSDTVMLASDRSGAWSLSTLATRGGNYLTATSSGSSKAYLYRDSTSGVLKIGTV